MSVHWKNPDRNIPVADFRDQYKWQQSERYKELIREQNKKSISKK